MLTERIVERVNYYTLYILKPDKWSIINKQRRNSRNVECMKMLYFSRLLEYTQISVQTFYRDKKGEHRDLLEQI